MIEFDSVKALREQLKATEQERDEARRGMLYLASKIGKLEQQRNHARWKAGVRKRLMRDLRSRLESVNAFVSHLEAINHDLECRRANAESHLAAMVLVARGKPLFNPEVTPADESKPK